MHKSQLEIGDTVIWNCKHYNAVNKVVKIFRMDGESEYVEIIGHCSGISLALPKELSPMIYLVMTKDWNESR
jgi:hypothetical protein